MNKKILITVFVSVCALISGAQTTYYRDSSGRLTGSVTTDGNLWGQQVPVSSSKQEMNL